MKRGEEKLKRLGEMSGGMGEVDACEAAMEKVQRRMWREGNVLGLKEGDTKRGWNYRQLWRRDEKGGA